MRGEGVRETSFRQLCRRLEHSSISFLCPMSQYGLRCSLIPLYRLPLFALDITRDIDDALAEEREPLLASLSAEEREARASLRPQQSPRRVPEHILRVYREMIPWDDEQSRLEREARASLRASRLPPLMEDVRSQESEARASPIADDVSSVWSWSGGSRGLRLASLGRLSDMRHR